MKKHLTRCLAVAVTALLLITALAPMTVFAAGAPVTGTSWNEGDMVRWNVPDDTDPVVGYNIDVYKDGSPISSTFVYPNYYDPYDLVKNCGPGFYTVSITAVYDNGSGGSVYSWPVEAPGYNYDGHLEHKHNIKHKAYKAPTCTEKGNEEYYYCDECGMYFWNSSGTDVIYDPSVLTLAAKGHSWGEWKTTKEPTSKSEGEAKRVCKNDSKHVETKKLAKLAETTAPTTVPATTTATEPTTVADSTAASTADGWRSATVPTTVGTGEGGFGGFIHNNPWAIIVGVAAILLILIAVPLIIILVVVSKKKKQRNNPNPPANPPRNNYPQNPYPQNPQNQYPQAQYPQGYPQNPPQGYPQQPPQGYPQNNPQQPPQPPQDPYNDSFNQ